MLNLIVSFSFILPRRRRSWESSCFSTMKFLWIHPPQLWSSTVNLPGWFFSQNSCIKFCLLFYYFFNTYNLLPNQIYIFSFPSMTGSRPYNEHGNRITLPMHEEFAHPFTRLLIFECWSIVYTYFPSQTSVLGKCAAIVTTSYRYVIYTLLNIYMY